MDRISSWEDDSRRTENPLRVDERVTTHFGSAHLDRKIADNITLRLLSRYGLRLYNADFRQRDTGFWTLGPHLDWAVNSWVDLTLGYHYERGLTDRRHEPQIKDDISYVNHHASLELTLRPIARTAVEFSVDYERNNFTSGIVGDIHNGAHESIAQGEVELTYRLTEAAMLRFGCQHGPRQFSFEPNSVGNTNVWLGAGYHF